MCYSGDRSHKKNLRAWIKTRAVRDIRHLMDHGVRSMTYLSVVQPEIERDWIESDNHKGPCIHEAIVSENMGMSPMTILRVWESNGHAAKVEYWISIPEHCRNFWQVRHATFSLQDHSHRFGSNLFIRMLYTWTSTNSKEPCWPTSSTMAEGKIFWELQLQALQLQTLEEPYIQHPKANNWTEIAKKAISEKRQLAMLYCTLRILWGHQ